MTYKGIILNGCPGEKEIKTLKNWIDNKDSLVEVKSVEEYRGYIFYKKVGDIRFLFVMVNSIEHKTSSKLSMQHFIIKVKKLSHIIHQLPDYFKPE